jgi:predicted CopG family antitoxin
MHRIKNVYMGSKNISLREDAYRRLADAKEEGESFSDAVDRLLSRADGEHPLYDLVGLLDEEEAAEVRNRAASFRESVDEGMEHRS